MKLWKRAKRILNLKYFNKSNYPLKVFKHTLKCPYDDQYILRMKIKEPHSEFKIPEELSWCNELVSKCYSKQKQNNILHGYCYITVRHGLHRAETEDVWHTDGYSEVTTHIPEQNYIVTSNHCTEYVTLPIKFPSDFDASKHNIVNFIDSKINVKQPKVYTAKPNTVYIFDPYVVHRRPPEAFGKQRTFVRITFVPIEICDDACTRNTLFSAKKYNRDANDCRNGLTTYIN